MYELRKLRRGQELQNCLFCFGDPRAPRDGERPEWVKSRRRRGTIHYLPSRAIPDNAN